MKKQWVAIALLAVIISISTVAAQAGKIPPFRMQQVSGKIFKAENLPLGKPIVIVYFSTECDHCSKLMKEMLTKTDDLKKASVAMITFFPLSDVSNFATQYNLKRFSNFYVGTEGTSFFVRNYFKIDEMPFLALYTKNGDLVKTYTNGSGLPSTLR